MSIIGKTIKIVGDVVGAEDLEIQGRIEGAVQLPSHRFVVAEGASVEGDLSVASVAINGDFNGRIVASERAELGKTANAQGSILTPTLEMADGAFFRGAVDTKG
mgnify:CR=1 FL=1|tara:strand:- start:116 stop:427 length:312 start_codon:yes stop_codon:yes gene_type:complete